MIDRTTKLHWRRRVKRRQQQIKGVSSSTEEHFDRHFFRRLGRLYEVRRFLSIWILLVVALIGGVVIQTRALGDYFLKLAPTSGGLYAEGMIGTYTNANPIFASTDVDASVSRLIFSGLLTYNEKNLLSLDLAKSWTVDDAGKIYTVHLKDNVKWHDGEQFTSEDVVFTFQTVQNPDARSPYFSSWQGIKVAADGDYKVTFTLPNVLASFPHSLTLGMLPKHKLEAVAPSDLRGSLFNNIEPVGTGPFKWQGVEVRGDTADTREQRIGLVANADYYKGRPKLDEFVIRAFLNEAVLIESFEEGRLNAVAGSLSVPLSGQEVREHTIPLTGAVMIFLNNESDILKDASVRRALTMATNQPEVIRQLRGGGTAVTGPLLPEHIGYNVAFMQYAFNMNEATKLLDKAGWVMDSASGVRMKDGNKLSLSLNTLNTTEYASVANQLQKQWRAVGVELTVDSMDQADLQTLIDERGYDALIYGIVMGLDADQFAYWHSSQADVRSQRRLNFSNYKSTAADTALEGGRTRIEPALREAKYKPFLQAWREDAPAIALYRPRFVYTTYGNLYNFNFNGMNSPVDRFNNVDQWMIRTTRAVAE